MSLLRAGLHHQRQPVTWVKSGWLYATTLKGHDWYKLAGIILCIRGTTQLCRLC